MTKKTGAARALGYTRTAMATFAVAPLLYLMWVSNANGPIEWWMVALCWGAELPLAILTQLIHIRMALEKKAEAQ